VTSPNKRCDSAAFTHRLADRIHRAKSQTLTFKSESGEPRMTQIARMFDGNPPLSPGPSHSNSSSQIPDPGFQNPKQISMTNTKRRSSATLQSASSYPRDSCNPWLN
jgi:hypothetical protein